MYLRSVFQLWRAEYTQRVVVVNRTTRYEFVISGANNRTTKIGQTARETIVTMYIVLTVSNDGSDKLINFGLYDTVLQKNSSIIEDAMTKNCKKNVICVRVGGNSQQWQRNGLEHSVAENSAGTTTTTTTTLQTISKVRYRFAYNGPPTLVNAGIDNVVNSLFPEIELCNERTQ